MNQIWRLREIQHAFDEFNTKVISYFDGYLKIIGEGSTCWNKTTHKFKGSFNHFERTHGHLLGITTDNACSKYSMAWEVGSILEAPGIESPEMGNYIPQIAHIIQLTLGAFMSNVAVKGRTKSYEALEQDQQLRENESTHIMKSQWLPKEVTARINKVSAMKSGFAKIIELARIARHCERPETDLYITENACWINDADTWSSNQVYSLSKGQRVNCSSMYYGCENTMEIDTGVAWARLPIMRNHQRVA